LTLIIRPSAAAARIGAVIEELRAIAPRQHFYQPDELHITLLSVISAHAGFEAQRAPLARYRAVFEGAFARAEPFAIRFTGVTASPDAVMVCGSAAGDALNALRDRLRAALAGAGLADGAEQRYRSVTAHMTIMRFQAQEENLARLAEVLQAARQRDLGAHVAEKVDLVVNNWYMSRDITRVVDTYRLEKDNRA
jgi:2'-5' RNA ligase